jgi:hypothetical protein
MLPRYYGEVLDVYKNGYQKGMRKDIYFLMFAMFRDGRNGWLHDEGNRYLASLGLELEPSKVPMRPGD